MLDVIIVEVADTSCNFGSVNSASDAQKLSSNYFVDLFWWFLCKERIPEMVAASDYLNVIQVMRVDSWKTNTAVVHLTSENFISEEVVSPDSSIAVSEVVGFSHGYIRKISE